MRTKYFIPGTAKDCFPYTAQKPCASIGQVMLSLVLILFVSFLKIMHRRDLSLYS